MKKLTAMEDVMMKTPPSGLALKVGKASLIRAIWPFTFTAQHCTGGQRRNGP